MEGDEFVVAIVGRWQVYSKGVWEFKLDKSRMGRCINLKGIGHLAHLEFILKYLFSLERVEIFAGCTYWADDMLTRMNGMEVEPCVIKSDANLRSFRSLAQGDKSINLCVTFRELVGSELRLVPPVQYAFVGLLPVEASVFKDTAVAGAPSKDASFCCPETDPSCGSLDDDILLAHIEGTEALLADGTDYVDDCEEGVCSEDDEDDAEEDDLSEEDADGEEEDYIFKLSEVDVGDCEDSPDSEDDFVKHPPAKKQLIEKGGNSNGVAVGRRTPLKISALSKSFKKGISIEDVYGYEDPVPMFDDTEFSPKNLNHVDFSKEDDAMFVGREFLSREDFKNALSIYAINRVFKFKFVRFTKKSLVAECFDPRCDWRVLASKIGGSDEYEVRKANLHHSCDVTTRSKFSKHATSRVVASLLRAKYAKASSGPRAREVPDILLDENNVRISYWKGWKAKELAVESAQGTEETSYHLLPVYLHVLQLANTGTVYKLETEKDELGDDRFKYVFLALGASLAGIRHLRRVVVVDGTHLNGKFRGCLLTASGQDANFQIFPIAFAVVDSENDASWTWFMKRLNEFSPDGNDLTFVSDRQQSIYTALGSVFPLAHHGACLVHVRRNVKAKYKKGKVSTLIWKAGSHFRIKDFNVTYNMIKRRNYDCWEFLETIGVKHWSRAHFKGDRFNLMSSNIAESLNNALLPARGSPIVALLEFIRRMISRWLAARRVKISKLQPGQIPDAVEKQCLKRFKESVGFPVLAAGIWDFEVVDKDTERYHVNLKDRTCSCLEFQTLNIPCRHAMAASHVRGLDYKTLIGSEHTLPTWFETVGGLVLPVKDPAEVHVPEEIRVLCLLRPKTRRPPGRPPKLRIPSIGEYEVRGKSQQSNKCGRCRGHGHNKATCTAPLK